MRPKSPRSAKRKPLEIEVKLKVRNLQRLRRALLDMGGEETVPRGLEQNWTWDFSDHRLRQEGKLLRLRQFAGCCLLTFKGVAQRSQHFKIREERETEIKDAATLGIILERLGLEVTFRYEKFRTSYSLRVRGQRHSVSLVVDETPIGNYLEIEGSEADIQRVAAQLGFDQEAFITESYLALFAKSRLGRNRRHMIFPRTVNAKSGRV
jgi:adenylate cyclase, class 2